MTKAQLNKIQSPIKQALLPKCGHNRNLPTAIVYGPTHLGGIGLRSLYIEQGIAQMRSLIICLRSNSNMTTLAKIALSWFQLLAGTSKPILTNVTTPLPHLDPMSWLPSI